MGFQDLGLSEPLLAAVADAGYTEPTPIQAQAIPAVLMGRDILGIAQTGTGKTAAFVLPMLDILSHGRARARMPRCLILEPTRELADQVAENFDKYGKNQKLTQALLIGGVNMTDQIKLIDRGVDVLIATPGRLLDLFGRGKVLLNGIEILVIDEADRMLDMGFIPDVEEICSKIVKKHQTLFFSATMPPPIKKLTDTFLDEPRFIEVARPAQTADTVTQSLVICGARQKREAMRAFLRAEDVNNAIVFCNRKSEVKTIHDSLRRHGFNAVQLHGDMAQQDRMDVLARFKDGVAKILVASDVAARGLDIPAVSHVINFDVPRHADDYVHRIGRTGRAGRSGRAMTLATPECQKYVEAIEKLTGKAIPVEALMEPATLASFGESSGAGTESPSRGRSGRDKKTASKPASGPASSAATEKRPEKAPEAKQARREKAPSPEKPPFPEKTRKPEKAHQTEKPRQPERPRQPETAGFGDHVPAFILKPVFHDGTN